MFYLSKYLVKKSEEDVVDKPLFKPSYPWIIVVSYTVIGLLVGALFINNVPTFISDHADTYNKEPIKLLDQFAYIYEGEIEDDTYFYIEIVEKYEKVILMDDEGNIIPVYHHNNIYYFKQEDVISDKVIILLYKNYEEDNEKIRSYTFGN